jgi:hypothetical protein
MLPTANVAALSAKGIRFVTLIIIFTKPYERNQLLQRVEGKEASQDERGEEKRRTRKEF